MEKVLSLWYAVSKTGQGRIFTSKPVRNGNFGIWTGNHLGFATETVIYMETEGFTLPTLRWDDEPIKLALTLSMD